jgi:hypothetical protein
MPSQKSVGTAITIVLCLVMAIVTMSHVEGSDSWSPTGSMSVSRHHHTATLLPDGRVLVSGGSDGSEFGVLGSAEIYDPALDTWSPTGSMGVSRFYHTATLLPDGRVLVSGGSDDSGVLGSAEIYDPARGTWSPTGSMGGPRHSPSATLLQDGRVLVSNGSSAEIYDPARGTWSPTGSMSVSRDHHTATLLLDGRVLVTGGLSTSNTWASAEIYDPALGTWSQTGSMTAVRAGHTATLLFNGRVLVSGGSALYSGSSPCDYNVCHSESAEIYDPVSGTWWETGSMRAGPRSYHLSTLLSDGRVLVSGGWYFASLASAEIYNPAHPNGPWSLTAVMSTDRGGHTSTLLPDGRVLVAGGGFLASAEIYSPGAPAPEDATPPQVLCAAADGAWHNSDVTIACTASDVGSGLANASDVTLNLTTNVPVGAETANAVTNSRQVCDMAGNCKTAGPFTGNKVDKKAPTIAIASPTAGGTYGVSAKVAASYACSDGGSGMTSCTGPVANGSLINTSKGTNTFAVTAIDSVGNSATVSVTYSVVPGRK